MRNLSGYQRIVPLLFSLLLACSHVAAETKKQDKSKEKEVTLLKRPRRKNSQASKTSPGVKAKFKSKNSYLNSLPKAILELPGGKRIKTYLAIDQSHQVQGLSGIRPHEFAEDEAMLFFNTRTEPRSFWMPDTYFNLDIFFLTQDLRIQNVERNVPHHPGRKNPEKIYRTGNYNCHHVLELKNSSVSKLLVSGSKLNWISAPDQKQIKQGILQVR